MASLTGALRRTQQGNMHAKIPRRGSLLSLEPPKHTPQTLNPPHWSFVIEVRHVKPVDDAELVSLLTLPRTRGLEERMRMEPPSLPQSPLRWNRNG